MVIMNISMFFLTGLVIKGYFYTFFSLICLGVVGVSILNRGFIFAIALKDIMLDGIAFKGGHHTDNNLLPVRPIVTAVAIFSNFTLMLKRYLSFSKMANSMDGF